MENIYVGKSETVGHETDGRHSIVNLAKGGGWIRHYSDGSIVH